MHLAAFSLAGTASGCTPRGVGCHEATKFEPGTSVQEYVYWYLLKHILVDGCVLNIYIYINMIEKKSS